MAGRRCLVRFGGARAEAERVRLVCFPHAGSGPALFRTWLRALPSGIGLIGVRLPGRESRLAEEPFTTVQATVEHVVAELRADGDAPAVMYGHCAGAVTAFHVALTLAREGVPVARLAVSSCVAPSRLAALPGLANGSVTGVDLVLAGQAPMAPGALRADLEPALWADLHVLADGGTDAVVDFPISAFHGRDDPLLTSTDLSAWREHTAGGLTLRQLPAGHFLFDAVAGEIVAALVTDIEADVPGPGGARGVEPTHGSDCHPLAFNDLNS